MTSDGFFIWVYLPGDTEPVVAANLKIDQTADKAVGEFVYGRSYLKRSNAIPIDPVALPLNPKVRQFTSNKGFPGAVLDSCPDRWGMKVIDRIEGKKDFPGGYILMNDPGRSGCLAFSRSADEPPVELQSREFSLEELLSAAEDVERGHNVDPELLKALHPGTGGARPKCMVTDDDGVWIAKFPSIDDDPAAISIPRLEYATLQLAQACGIRTADTRLQQVQGKDVCLVRRFDRDVVDGGARRRGYLSARTVFYADSGYEAVATGSYARIARWMGRFGCPASDKEELYRRMVFNCVVKNTDDHELNHGLVHTDGASFELAPAFDIVPTLARHQVYRHALLIGDSSGGTLENLLSNTEAFGLSLEGAQEIIADVQVQVQHNWLDIFYEAGFGDQEIRLFEHIFTPLPSDETPRQAWFSPSP